MEWTPAHRQFVIVASVALGCTLIGWTAAWLSLRSHYGPAAAPIVATPLREGEVPDPLLTPPSGYEWTRQPAPYFAIPPFAEHLRGVKIVLDPGHVGQRERDGFKVGPTGLREAVVNLAVAKYLREFLETAGATVVMTRDRDISVGLSDEDDLAQRATIANRSDADLLLSIHHNAAGSDGANFTTVFFHDDPDHNPASLSAARHVLWGLNDALRLQQCLPVPLATDLAIYKGSGFRLLRLAEIPAVLSEASFYTNLSEEDRLRDPVYNRREAYGLFVGLARWAAAGLPRVSLAEGPKARAGGATLKIKLDDGLTSRRGMMEKFPKIIARSICVELSGNRLPFRYDPVRAELTVDLPAMPQPGAWLFVDFQNVFGQHVGQPRVGVR